MIIEIYTTECGLGAFVALGALAVCALATAGALCGREWSRPSTVLAATAGAIATLAAVVPIVAARQTLLAAAGTAAQAATAGPAGTMHFYALVGGGAVALCAAILSTAAIVRRGPDAGRSVALLLVLPCVVPAGLALHLGWRMVAPLPHDWFNRELRLSAIIEEPTTGVALAAAALTLLTGGLLIGARARRTARPLSVAARTLACVMAVLGPLAFVATRPLARDAQTPLPNGDQVSSFSHSPIEELPVADVCRLIPASPIVKVLEETGRDGTVLLDGRRVTPEVLVQDLETLRRNWRLLRPGIPHHPPSVVVHLRAADDPRRLTAGLRVVRDTIGDDVFLLARRRRMVHTATLGVVEQNDNCAVPFTLADDQDTSEDVIPLARVTDAQALARLLSAGGHRVGLSL